MRFLLISVIILTLLGCASKITIQPDTLPVAYLNEPYTATIDISGGRVIDFSVGIHFSDSSFKLLNDKKSKDFNHLIIGGTPTSLTPITVDFGGNTYGTNFPGQEFEKTYTIEVKQR